jgi:hypothetical protein
MAQPRINIFYIIAAVCCLLLVVYAWFMFLPTYEGSPQYADVKNFMILLSILFIVASGFIFYMAIRGKETESEELVLNPEVV